ncbi:MAG: PQQ-binding-like beta-propeller repeat protein, partial [Planctomycetaceae bacterium]|nr:PQQ-binding-like beta-propeller repeat protein [Planctomycetaceae bacterium]
FLWQHSNQKLKSGRVNDWPMQGIVSSPLVDGDRLWYVTNRGEVVCLDIEGFRDQENDGPFREEEVIADNEADVVWKFDMMAKLGVQQHNMCTCSLTSAGDILFVVTSNGLDESHINFPAPKAPAFFAMNKHTAEVLWTDDSPNKGLLHGSWSSPTYAVLGGQPQVLFPGGDGWLYSFAPQGDGKGHSKLLWKFDGNPKEANWILGGRGRRNPYITMPVIYDQKVYFGMGQDVEHGEGPGDLWCIDPAKKLDGSDVSPTLAFDAKGQPLPFHKKQLVNPENGEYTKPNPNSAVVWHYSGFDLNGDGKIEFEETMHRSCGHVTIKDNLLFIAEFSGLFHCLNAKTGQLHWTHDSWAASYAASPLIVDGKVYIGNEDGDVTIFRLSKKKEILNTINMDNSVYTSPIVANNVLFMTNKNTMFAIAHPAK